MERMNLLVCDLDGTLLGDEDALQDFAVWYSGARCQFRLAYSSGRFIDSIRKSIATSDLPSPDAIVGGVGTEIYDVSALVRAAFWPPMTFGWNPYVVRAVCEKHSQLKVQPEHLLSYRKVSYYGRDLDESFLNNLLLELADVGQQVNLVYSSNRDLDVVPEGADKGAAAAFLARRWRIDVQNVIVAGDSGNDAAMFRAGFRGIVVGNALPELQSLVAPNVYHATAEFAYGVLEGVNYWLRGPLLDEAKGDRSSWDRDAGRDRHE